MIKGNRGIHPNALPNYEKATISRQKIERYVLDPTHSVGKNKAVVFKSALGFNQF